MENANNCQFLITKSEAGETLNDLDELLSCENFDEQQTEQVDGIMKQLDFLDDDSASAIGDLLLAVTSEQRIAKSCDVENWESITGLEQIEIPCLVKKSELNIVDEFVQKFVTKSEMESEELEVISSALETISDLDNESLGAVHSLLKIEFSETTVTKLWPSLFKRNETNQAEAEQTVAKKSGLKWSFTGMIQKQHSRDVLNPLTGQYRKANDSDDNKMSKSDEQKWPSLSG